MRATVAIAGVLIFVQGACAQPAWHEVEAPAPPNYAPAFGLRAADLAVDVRPESGAATLFEVDTIGGIALRRARSTGNAGAGLFGRGWVSELDTCVTPFAGGFAVRRPQGMSLFVPLREGVFVSLWGEVELLRATEAGHELIDAGGRTSSFDAEGRLVAIEPGVRLDRESGLLRVRAGASEAALHLDARGRVIRAEAAGETLRYTYAKQELSSVRGPERQRTYTVEAGRVTRVGGRDLQLRLSYDARGRVTLLDTGGWQQAYRYTVEGLQRSASVHTPTGRWTYALLDDGWHVQGPRGAQRVRFDRRGSVVAGEGEAAGDPWPQALPGGRVARRHDAAGRLVALEGPGVRESFAWTNDGRLAVRTSVDGRTSRYGYDAEGRLAKHTDPAGTTTYAYDEHGQVAQVRTPAGVTWSFTHAHGAVVRRDGPGGVVTEERQAGRLVRRSDASDAVLDYVYDADGRATEVAASTGESVRFAYAADGTLSGWSGASGDARVSVAGATRTVTVGRATLRTESTAGGETLRSSFGTIQRVRDAEGRVTRLVTDAGTFRFVYDAHGQRVAVHYPGGVVQRTRRDDLGRAVVQRASRGKRTLHAERTRYNARHEVAQRSGPRGETVYGYDAAGRLAKVDTPRGSRGYGYDGDGNRVRETRGEHGRAFAYDARGRLETRGPERFVHDAAGRLTERTHRRGRDRFGYDGFGRLAWVQRAGAPRVRYGYDALGRVVTRVVDEAQQRFVYDGPRLLAIVGPGERQRVFVYGPQLDEPLAYRDDDGPWTYLLASELHTVHTYVDGQGRVLARAELGPFGEVLAAPRGRPVFFAGRLFDPVARVYPMRARTYDPDLGRFLTPDPSGLAGGINAYAYARNRPLDRIDPLGLWDWVPSWARRDAGDVETPGASVVSGSSRFLSHVGGFAEHMWEDVKAGRARDRIYGSVDAYSSFLTFGLAGTNLSAFANSQEEAERGAVWGDRAGWAFALISARPLITSGIRALPQLPGAVMNGLRGARASAPSWLPRAGAALAGAPAAASRGLQWAWANRGPLGSSLLGFLQGQAAGVWNVTGRPFVSAGEAGIDLLSGLVSSLRRSAPAARTAPTANAVTRTTTSAGQGGAAEVQAGKTTGMAGALDGKGGGPGTTRKGAGAGDDAVPNSEGMAVQEVDDVAALSAEDAALIRELERKIDDEMLDYMHVDDGLGVRNNGSGESAASIEALNRARQNRFLIVDRQGKVVRELTGPESVDFNAPKYLEAGQAFVLQNRSTGVVTVWDTKGVSASTIRERMGSALPGD